MKATSAVDRRLHPRVVLSVVLLCGLTLPGIGCTQFNVSWPTWLREPEKPAEPIEFYHLDNVKQPEPPSPKPVEPSPPKPVEPPPPKPVEPPPHDPVAAKEYRELLGHAFDKINTAKDFHCLLVRVEVLGDQLCPAEELDYYQRFNPHSLKLEWVGERAKGRKVIYVAGANDGKVLVQTGGLSGRILTRFKKTLRFDLTSAIVRSQGRNTPDVAGYNNLVTQMVTVYDQANEAGQVRVTGLPPTERDGRKLRCFEVILDVVPPDVDASKMTVWFDLDAQLPVHTVLYDGGGRMVEDYDWRNIEFDVGLTDADFTFENEP